MKDNKVKKMESISSALKRWAENKGQNKIKNKLNKKNEK